MGVRRWESVDGSMGKMEKECGHRCRIGASRSRADEAIHLEHFAADPAANSAPAGSFEVQLASSGVVLQVPANTSLEADAFCRGEGLVALQVHHHLIAGQSAGHFGAALGAVVVVWVGQHYIATKALYLAAYPLIVGGYYHIA